MKTLLRIQRLVEFPCNTAFWLRIDEERASPTVLNGQAQRYCQFGQSTPYAMPLEMQKCCSDAAVVDAPADEDFITVLAPVRDSLQDVIGCVVISTWHPDSQNAPPAWS